MILLYSGIVNEEWSKVNIGFLISVVVVMLVMGCISTPMFHAGDFRGSVEYRSSGLYSALMRTFTKFR
ncbi:MAG: hypothetical protein ACLU99_07085 [Alphaproteobacteria bacterium]